MRKLQWTPTTGCTIKLIDNQKNNKMIFFTGSEIMNNYLKNHLHPDFHVVKIKNGYAEIQSADTADIFGIYAVDYGDPNNYFVYTVKLS